MISLPSGTRIVIFRRTHIDAFSGASSAVYANDRGLTMVDLFCYAGATARQVPPADSEALSRESASGHGVLTRGLMAGDEVLTTGMTPG